VRAARAVGDRAVLGDVTQGDVLEDLGCKDARLVVLTVNDARATELAVRRIRATAPDVAIVAPEAGTTRDAIEAVVEVGGFPFRLVDTAGLRNAAGRVERLGIEVARRFLAGADLVVYCREAGHAVTEEERRFVAGLGAPVVRVRTKWDVATAEEVLDDGEVAVSVETGEGLDVLKDALLDPVFRGVVENRDEVPVVTRRRQADLLASAHDEVKAFRGALAEGIPPEVASAHLKSAESALEEILGAVATEDVLDRVFRDFCIGK